jgi:hypothetical protein
LTNVFNVRLRSFYCLPIDETYSQKLLAFLKALNKKYFILFWFKP